MPSMIHENPFVPISKLRPDEPIELGNQEVSRRDGVTMRIVLYDLRTSNREH
jgi:hypothetical protein